MNNIEILEEWIKIDRDIRNNSTESDYDKFCEEKCVAIENLIAENKYIHKELNLMQKGLNDYSKVIESKDKEIENLIKENKDLKEENKIAKKMGAEIMGDFIKKDVIPKSKIKEKIEELKGRKMDIVTSQVHNTDEKLKILEKDKIREAILKELLEEGE